MNTAFYEHELDNRDRSHISSDVHNIRNPFATQHVRPGSLPYMGLPDCDIRKLADRFFQEKNCVGQIVGPHGSGKTSLTFAMEPYLRDRFHTIRRITIRRSTGLPSRFTSLFRPPSQRKRQTQNVQLDSSVSMMAVSRTLPYLFRNSDRDLIILDGIEELSWLHRRCLIKSCTHLSKGILLTCHRPVTSSKTILTIVPTVETFARIVARLLEDNWAGHLFTQNLIRKTFRDCDGNCREALMNLFDHYEVVRRQQIPDTQTMRKRTEYRFQTP